MDIMAVLGAMVVSEGASQLPAIVNAPAGSPGTHAPIWTTLDRSTSDAAFSHSETMPAATRMDPSLLQLCVTLPAGLAALHSIVSMDASKQQDEDDEDEEAQESPKPAEQ